MTKPAEQEPTEDPAIALGVELREARRELAGAKAENLLLSGLLMAERERVDRLIGYLAGTDDAE